MLKKKKYNALIIGAGNIGAFVDNPRSKAILTHAHAYAQHPNFKLIGFVDKDLGKSKKAASIWGTVWFKSIEEAFEHSRIDVVSVAVPDGQHYFVLKKLAGLQPKAVFAEKPLVTNQMEAKYIKSLYQKKNIPILVNYSRRFVPHYQTIKKDIEKGNLGGYLAGAGYYGRGLIHNGSHLIDLLRYFVGSIEQVTPLDSLVDFSPKDKSISAILRFANGKQFYLQCVDSRKYSIFEIDLMFEKSRIRFCNSGFKIEKYTISNNTFFKGQKNMLKKSGMSTSLDKAMLYAVDNIFQHLENGQDLKVSLQEGYDTLQACIKIGSFIRR